MCHQEIHNPCDLTGHEQTEECGLAVINDKYPLSRLITYDVVLIHGVMLTSGLAVLRRSHTMPFQLDEAIKYEHRCFPSGIFEGLRRATAHHWNRRLVFAGILYSLSI